MLTTEENTPTAVTDEMLDAFFAKALERHEAEDWQAAEAFYQKVLAVIPDQANVNYNLGMLKLQLNQANASLVFFRNALAANGEEPKYWVRYIEALMLTGQKKKAIEVLTDALEQGLYGDEVNALVDQLTKRPAAPTPTAVNYSHQAAVIPNQVKQQRAINVAKPAMQSAVAANSEKPRQNAPAKKSLQAYLNNPQVTKVLALQQSGKLKQAKQQGAVLLKKLPNHPVLLTCLGGIALSEGALNHGIALLERSLKVVPEQTTALSYLCVAYIKLNKATLAISYADKAIALNPDYAEAYINKANALCVLHRDDEAIAVYQKALALTPDNSDIYFNIGSALSVLDRDIEALPYFEKAIDLNAKDALLQASYGEVLSKLKRYQASLPYFDAAIALDATHQPAWINRGVAYEHLKQYELARTDFEQATKLKPSRKAYHNLADVLRKLGQFEQGLVACDMAISLDQTSPESYSEKGLLLENLRRFDEALDCFNRAIAIDKNYAEAHWNKALLHLRVGDFTQGWQQYESRWNKVISVEARHIEKPLWLGAESIKGKTLFIYPEQGFGDYIQFCRYVHAVEQLGAKVVLEVEKPLLSLIRTLKSKCQMVVSGDEIPSFDYHCPIMSLPLALKTQLETIPANTPYLYANEDQVNIWRKQLGNQKQMRVGLVWSGSTTHANDYHRSVALEVYAHYFHYPLHFMRYKMTFVRAIEKRSPILTV